MNTQQQTTTDRRARERLIADHLGMTRRIARKMSRHADPSAREDLESSALMGLVEAASRYDFQRVEPFAAFAYRRIQGAVLDGMRRIDFLPRRVRTLANKTTRAKAELEQKLGRAPESSEIAVRLDVSEERYEMEIRMLPEVCFVELSPQLTHEAKQEDEAIDSLERQRRIALVREALTHLSTRDQRILSLYYAEDLTYAEIGKLLGVSEARICQLHTRAINRLREELGPC
jgi:RNA polymerase sigma factor for flagellar operon FliA